MVVSIISKQRVLLLGLALGLAAGLAGCSDGPSYRYPGDNTHKPLPPVIPPEGYVWTELPAPPPASQTVAEGGDLQVITHRATFGSTRTRNYTMLFDREEKVSLWVAYPQHRVFISGSADRADKYIYDPSVPESWQATENRGYGEYPYQRGHQIAAADRNSSQAANDQTFYMTNMTPQDGELNGGLWANLETWVRSRANEGGRQDTLYVVTGCWIDPVPGTGGRRDRIDDRNGVAIPDAYYKVVMRTASGKRAFPSDEDCEFVGFWVDNSEPASGDRYQEWTESVAEIERRTGFDFFPSISNAAQNANDNPAEWAGLQ
ncbi:MAG: DNA/RNA non-specific endonuclease [Alistipes sp.]|jgi:endonuclease G|nr:DNA/RNA non-specific endonuclease [Alistipes sp.]